MNFVTIKSSYVKSRDATVIHPTFAVSKEVDNLLCKGKAFYALWDEKKNRWSTDEYDVVDYVDHLIDDAFQEVCKTTTSKIEKDYLRDFDNGRWEKYKKYCQLSPSSPIQLDSDITFLNQKTTKEDYRSKTLSYDIKEGKTPGYEKIISTLYDSEERRKIEWAIGSVISGDSKKIQKFLVFYGEAGTGKSTILNIIQMLFEGYCGTFNAKDLANSSKSFATAAFKDNPLVMIQHDGDLSRIEDNTLLNSIIAHEEIGISEKYKAEYPMRVNSMLFMGTNRPVKITDAKSGIIRRLIDVKPTGELLDPDTYQECMGQVPYELGAIANHCLKVYKKYGKHYYDRYKPLDMMFKTDVFFNFVESCYPFFEKDDGATLKAAYSLYKEYCDNTGLPNKMPMYKFREDLKDYFEEFLDRATLDDGTRVRSYYKGFKKDKFTEKELTPDKAKETWLKMDSTKSVLDEACKDCPAQYAKGDAPTKAWDRVGTTLKDLDTSKLHYVRVPENLIVIDFDLKDANGNKSKELNLEAASKWPPTYAEFSKSGAGVHLHYYYSGDPKQLDNVYSDDIEIKVYSGKGALRRIVTACNTLAIATISSGLPLKKRSENMVDFKVVASEKMIRALIKKNLRKESHPGTKPSVDFIKKILDDAYESGEHYDVTDMRNDIVAFAASSTNHADYCLEQVGRIHYCSDDVAGADSPKNDRITFYDIEVFPNLLLVNWKYRGEPGPCTRMINPSPAEVEEFLKMKLVGFNCRRYDNHILYARMMGYSLEALFQLSQDIIAKSPNAFFGSAYNLSYADVYDFCAKKQSLKKWEIELGIHHQEWALPWDQPVPEELWPKVAEYCDNDVIATEATFEANIADFEARCVLADIAGGCPNDTSNMLSGKLIFGKDKNPQKEFVYTDLATGISVDMDGNETFNETNKFDGYAYDHGVSTYRGIKLGEGGLVIADPGMYRNVKTFDIASMHPHTVIALNLFGKKYTARFKDLVDARIAIKHRDVEALKTLFGGAFARFANVAEEELEKLAKALKIVINSVYGLTSAHFSNLFKDERNIDNIVAKRGALFMATLKGEVEKLGAHVVHIKTDSIKIDNPTPEVEQFIYDFGKKYGYTFEIEAEYEKICLVNNAVYIAYEKGKGWTATGTQFAVPYVFKKLFTHEKIEFDDLCQTIAVSNGGELDLDFNENLPEGEHDYKFVGKVGRFCPVKEGCGGAQLFRMKDDKYFAPSGTKGYRWLESEDVLTNNIQNEIDMSYYDRLADEAVKTISEFGDFEKFAIDEHTNMAA
mgnify:FL=1